MNIRYLKIVLLLSLSWPVLGQSGQAVQVNLEESFPEEIRITRNRFIYQLRDQMEEAEMKAYNIFNQFNDEKRFKISCSMHRPTGTAFERQICQPEFEREATAVHARAFWESYRTFMDPETPEPGSSTVHVPVEMLIASQQQEYQAKFRQIAQQHPDFLEAVVQYSQMREQFESLSEASND